MEGVPALALYEHSEALRVALHNEEYVRPEMLKWMAAACRVTASSWTLR